EPPDRRRVRLRVGRRVRDDVGVRAQGVQPPGAQHAPLLGVHGGDDQARGQGVQLRAVHTRCGDPPFQAPVGWHGCPAPLGVVGAGRRGVRGPDPRPTRVPLGDRRVAPAAGPGDEPPGALARPAERDVLMRHQPPVHSPIPLRALLGGVVRRGSRGAAHLRLTELLAREYDATGVVLCGSGTQALQLALRAALARVGRPCDVALPAFSCYDVAAAAVAVGRPLRFYDLDPGTLAPEPNSFDRVLRDGARIAVVSPLYGIPVPWDALEATAARHGAVLIEDAAQGHGAAWRGRPLGAMGEISVLSFGRGKGWTGGAGGAVLFRGDSGAEAAEFCRSLLGAHPGGGAHTAVVAQWALGRPRLYGIPASLPFLGLGETRYRDAGPPVPMDAAVAARILASRAAADEEAAARRRNAARYSGAVSGSITVPHDPAG